MLKTSVCHLAQTQFHLILPEIDNCTQRESVFEALYIHLCPIEIELYAIQAR